MSWSCKAAAGLMLGLLLGILTLSCDRGLHAIFHPDEHGAQHECVLTTLAKNHVLPATTDIAIPSPAPSQPACLVAFTPRPACSADVRLSDGRAPPV